jgi:hypothetical protein
VSNFPDFLIIGAPKCGTTSLFHYLGEHPRVYPSPEKEPHFYSYIEEERPHWGTDDVDEYTSLFRRADANQLCMEASTWYLYSRTAARQIRRHAPDTKCIALLRQPVDRAYSGWSFRLQQGWESLSFEDAIMAEEKRVEEGKAWGTHYLRAGRYSHQVRRFYEQLGRDQVRIFWFEDFRSDSQAVVQEALSFLGLEPTDTIDVDQVHNPTRLPRSTMVSQLMNLDWLREIARQLLPEAARRMLRNTIRQANEKPRPPIDEDLHATLTERVWPDVERLENVVNADLSRWAP